MGHLPCCAAGGRFVLAVAATELLVTRKVPGQQVVMMLWGCQPPVVSVLQQLLRQLHLHCHSQLPMCPPQLWLGNPCQVYHQIHLLLPLLMEQLRLAVASCIAEVQQLHG
jgi:hypothetical protein